MKYSGLIRVSLDDNGPLPIFVIVSRNGQIYTAKRQESLWTTQLLDLQLSNANGISQIVPLSPLGVFALAAADSVYFVDAEEGQVLRTVKTERMIARSLQCTYSGNHGSEPGSPGLSSLTLCYVGEETGDCVVQTYVPTDDCEAIYLRNPKAGAGEDECSCEPTKEIKKRVKNPGTWHVLSDGSVVGIRLVIQRHKQSKIANQGLRRRHQIEQRQQYSFGNWEVWAASPCDKPDMEECRPLFETGDESNHLVVSGVGPKVSVGLRSVAFAFGNVIKLVTSGGQERYEADAESRKYDALMNTASRRRKTGQVGRVRASS